MTRLGLTVLVALVAAAPAWVGLAGADVARAWSAGSRLRLAAAAARAASPAVVVSFPGTVRSFDYDAGRIAWIDTAWTVRTRALRTGAQTAIHYTSPYEEIPLLATSRRLDLQDGRLLWSATRGRGMFEQADRVFTATVGATKAQSLATVVHTEGIDGGYVTGIAGDASGFSYGIVTVAMAAAGNSYEVSGGGIWSVVGGTARRVPGAPPAFVLARAAGRVAIAPADSSEQSTGTPRATTTVEIVDATTGALVSSFSPGPIRALALSGRVAAVLVGRHIERYEVGTGQLIGTTSVPSDTAPDLDIGGQRIAFRTGGAIELMDAATGRVTTLARTAPWRVTALAIAGRAVAWSESRRIAPGEPSRRTFSTRIRTLALAAG